MPAIKKGKSLGARRNFNKHKTQKPPGKTKNSSANLKQSPINPVCVSLETDSENELDGADVVTCDDGNFLI